MENFRSEIVDLLTKCREKIESFEIDDSNLSVNSVLRSYRNVFTNSKVVHREKLKIIERNIDLKYGPHLRLLYHQVVIFELYLENIKKINDQNLPSGILNYLEQDFSRIVDLAMDGKEDVLSFNNFQFLSYIEKLCFRCYPVGNHNISISGIPRSLLLKQSATEALNFAVLIFKLSGHYPLFELHYNPHRFRLFNPDGWNEVFYLTMQLLVRRQQIKGVFGASWFFDPSLKVISPELYYIREFIEKIGGCFFIGGSSEQDKKNAFALSKKRRVAYEEGRYIPTSYVMVIPRDTLIEFYS